MEKRPKNREEVYDQRQQEALAELAGLAKAGGVVGGDAERAIARSNYRLKQGLEVDHAGLANPDFKAMILSRLPLIILCLVIIGGLAVKYLF